MTPKATKRQQEFDESEQPIHKKAPHPLEITPEQTHSSPHVPPALPSRKLASPESPLSPRRPCNKHERAHMMRSCRRKLFQSDKDDICGEVSESVGGFTSAGVAETSDNSYGQENQPRTSQRDRDHKIKKDVDFTEQMRFVASGKCEEQFEIVDIADKGKGLVTQVHLRKGYIVIEYVGELLDANVGQGRKEKYILAGERLKGCCIFEFKWSDRKYCIDPSGDPGKARFMNHSKKNANVKPKVVTCNKGKDGYCPMLVFQAIRDIQPGEELVYDYGDRSAEAIQSCPWLKE